jgi:hypothetical protein
MKTMISRPFLVGEIALIVIIAYMTLRSLESPAPFTVKSTTTKVESMHYFLPCYQYRSLTHYYFGTPQLSKEGALAQIQAASNIVSAFIIEIDLPALPPIEQ